MDNLCEDTIIEILKFCHIRAIDKICLLNAIYEKIVLHYFNSFSKEELKDEFDLMLSFGCINAFKLLFDNNKYDIKSTNVWEDSLEILKFLSRWRGPNGECFDPRFCWLNINPCIEASIHGYSKIVKVLLEWKTPYGYHYYNLGEYNHRGYINRSLQLAAAYGHLETVKILLKWDKYKLKNKDYYDGLWYCAIKNGYKKIAKLIYKHK